MYIKVDYSIKRKSPEGRPDMPGEFAIFTKKTLVEQMDRRANICRFRMGKKRCTTNER